MSALADAHIEAQARLRAIVTAAIAAAWNRLGEYDEDQVETFLAAALPVVFAGQRQSAALTNAFLARALERAPFALNIGQLTGAAVRSGTPPEEVYRRPFVTVWTALKSGTRWEEAVSAGLARATGTAATDIQLSMRSTLADVGERDERISGFRRVPDGGACVLCLMASTQRYRTGDLMPIHNFCGCGVDVLTADVDVSARGIIDSELLRELKRDGRAGDLSYQQAAGRARVRAQGGRARARDWRAEAQAESDARRRARLLERADRYERLAAAQENTAIEYSSELAQRRAEREGVQLAVQEHGELGPVLVNAAHTFTEL